MIGPLFSAFIHLLACIWGLSWAVFLQHSRVGRFMAAQRTWLTVVIGVGGDVLLLRLLLPRRDWQRVVGILAVSSIGIIARSILNEHRQNQELIERLD